MKRAAIFDLDKTLVQKNTGRLYMKWRYGRGEARKRDVVRLTKWLLEYHLGTINPRDIVERALSGIKGIEEERFRRDMESFFDEWVRKEITTAARDEVERCRERGDLLCILTASTHYAADPLARELDIEHVLASTLELDDAGRFTGRCTQLAYGDEKVVLAEAWARAHDVDLDVSAFYSDSVSDLPMLERVGEPRIVNADPRLTRIARKRGWPQEKWVSSS